MVEFQPGVKSGCIDQQDERSALEEGERKTCCCPAVELVPAPKARRKLLFLQKVERPLPSSYSLPNCTLMSSSYSQPKCKLMLSSNSLPNCTSLPSSYSPNFCKLMLSFNLQPNHTIMPSSNSLPNCTSLSRSYSLPNSNSLA